VGERALQGDATALALVARSARLMGQAIASAANLLDPDVIVLGGGVPELGDIYMDPVRASFRELAMPVPAQRAEIRAAQFGYDAGVVGAAAVALTVGANAATEASR
jgi:glucokinase